MINVTSTDPYVWKGYILAVALLLGNTFSAVVIHLSAKYGFVMSMRVRAALVTAIYRKVTDTPNKTCSLLHLSVWSVYRVFIVSFGVLLSIFVYLFIYLYTHTYWIRLQTKTVFTYHCLLYCYILIFGLSPFNVFLLWSPILHNLHCYDPPFYI